MKVSVVVPAFNEEKLLPATLLGIQSAAAAFTEQKWDWEIVVCDNNSTDGTAQIARKHGARVIFEPQNQISRARNTGASIARGEWLLFVDADSIPSRNLFADLAQAMEDPKILGGGATVVLDEDWLVGRFFAGGWNCISQVMRWAAGSFLFCRNEAFQNVGGFSLHLFATEELELCQRLKRLARKRGQKMKILTRHPLVTSARKIHLYSKSDHLRFLLRTVLRPASLRSREACPLWYNGTR